MAISHFSRRKTLQMQRNESRAQMRPGKTPRSPSTSSSILSGSILGEENISNEVEAETEDCSVFSTKEETNLRPTRMDVLMEAGAAHYVPIHTGCSLSDQHILSPINPKYDD